jgi:type IX secretion system PorP/SprF family membrane protein
MKRFGFVVAAGIAGALLFALPQWAEGQRDVQFTQFRAALNYYNPAAVGLSRDLNVMAVYRIQWLGWTNAPTTLYAAADMPFTFLKREHGVGVVAVSDVESSAYRNLHIGLQYAFIKKIGNGTLRIGLQPGMINMTVDGSGLTTPVDSLGGEGGATDPAIPTAKDDAKAFDIHAGIYFTTDRFYIGAAAKHLLQPEIDEENLKTFIEREYNFIVGYNIHTNNPLLQLQPSVFVKTNLNIWQADVAARAVYGGKYSAGLQWRMNESVALTLGASFGKIDGGYAYDFPISAIRRGTTGSHELYLKYRLQLSKGKQGKSKHKSVRLL